MIKEDIETIENAKEFIESTIDAVKKDGSRSTKLRCIGTLCGGVEFDSSQAGCAPLLHYCVKCNEAIRAELGASIHSNVKGATSHDHLQAIVEETSSDQNSDSTDDGEEFKSQYESMKSPAKQQSGDFADSVAGDDKQRKEREAEEAERICKAQEDKPSKRTNESKQSCAHVHNLFHAIALRECSDGSTIVLHNLPRTYIKVSKAVTGARRHLFVLKDVNHEDLYWYEEYAAYLSRNKFYVSMCKMTNGDVLLAIMMTRCYRGRCDLMIHSYADNKVHIVKEYDYCKAHPDVKVDPDEPIDEAKYEALKKAFIVKSRLIFDPARGLPITSKKYSMSDAQLKRIGALTDNSASAGNGHGIRLHKAPDRLTPEKKTRSHRTGSATKKRQHTASVRKQKQSRKKLRVAKETAADAVEEPEWEDESEEGAEEEGESDKTKTTYHRQNEEVHTLVKQLKGLLDSAQANSKLVSSDAVAEGSAAVTEGSAAVANAVHGGKQLTPATIQLLIENQVEMARLQEQARKYHLAQQLLNLLS